MTQTIDLGPLKVESSNLSRQLQHDLRDDWYPDTLGFEDLLTAARLNECLTAKLTQGHGRIEAETRLQLNIPKKGFVLRSALETSFADRAYYHALVSFLAPFYDGLISRRALGHRVAPPGRRRNRYLLRHPIEQWKLFTGYVRTAARPDRILLVADLQNYYEHISVKRLANCLEELVAQLTATPTEKATIRIAIEQLHRCLVSWCYGDGRGLPQNRDASSFLANIFMKSVDDAMVGLGYDYYRYMDDIRILTDSVAEARRALRDLCVELRVIGLSVNASKTEILEPSTVRYTEELSFSDLATESIDSMWKSKSLAVILRSLAPLRKLALKLLAEDRTHERSYRFCVNKFASLALCAEARPPDEFFGPLIEATLSQLSDQPSSSDMFVRFLKAAPTNKSHMEQLSDFLRNPDRSIYEWQNYLIWQLLVYKNFSTEELLAHARTLVLDSGRNAERAGAILFLGAMGDYSDRIQIAEQFETLDNYLLQRNALIAIHELPYDGVLGQRVSRHIIPSLVGTYRRLKESYRGRYFLPLPSISHRDLFDQATAYE